jgi:hypothetical protein
VFRKEFGVERHFPRLADVLAQLFETGGVGDEPMRHSLAFLIPVGGGVEFVGEQEHTFYVNRGRIATGTQVDFSLTTIYRMAIYRTAIYWSV